MRWRTAVTLGILLSLTACQQQQLQEPDVTAPPPVVRHDIEPLERTFPALGIPESASWIAWGNAAEASQLKLRWIDAVVQVAPETMDSLVQQHESEVTMQRPAVQKVLEPDVPPGPFRTGVELNMAFGAERRSTRVFLDPPRDTVVLQSSLAG
ncbi:MAG: hypothetical protein ACPGVG_04125 [Mycobacterium sp.]